MLFEAFSTRWWSTFVGSQINFRYDVNGNLISDGTNSYSWNARSQFAAIDAQEQEASDIPTAKWQTGLGIDSFLSRRDANGRPPDAGSRLSCIVPPIAVKS